MPLPDNQFGEFDSSADQQQQFSPPAAIRRKSIDLPRQEEQRAHNRSVPTEKDNISSPGRPSHNIEAGSAKIVSPDQPVEDGISYDILREKFRSFLIEKDGITPEAAEKFSNLLDEFARQYIPEIQTISELRGRIYAKEKPDIPKYVAVEHGDTMEFYRKYYRDGVRSGALLHSDIKKIDGNFVTAFNRNNVDALGAVVMRDSVGSRSNFALLAALLGIPEQDARDMMRVSQGGTPRSLL